MRTSSIIALLMAGAITGTITFTQAAYSEEACDKIAQLALNEILESARAIKAVIRVWPKKFFKRGKK